MTANPRTVVAGYDGSPAARAAVEAAIDRTGADGHLVIVHAYQVPADYVGAFYYDDMVAHTLERAGSLMEDLARDCERLADTDWEPDVIAGRAGDAICRVAEARHADEVVIGTRGHGPLRALLGSVSMDVLHRAACPVVVIPERMVQASTAPAGDRAAAA